MVNDDTVTVIHDGMGERQRRRLVSDPELKLSLTTALLMGSALSGTQRKGRDHFREAVARDILESFSRAGYSVLGKAAEAGPMPRVYMGIDLDQLDDGTSRS